MSDQATGSIESQKGRERDRPSASKRKRGRPKGSTQAVVAARGKDPTGELAKAEKVAQRQGRILARQREDCRRLAKVIKDATPGTADPKDIGALARATNLLHDMERQAHDFGAKGAQVKAVIVIPAGPATMAAWAKEADRVLGTDVTTPLAAVEAVVLEDDIQGDPPPEPPEAEEEDD